MMETIAERMQRVRKDCELSQTQLAEITGISQASLSRYEHGHQFPGVLALLEIANALGTTTDYLLTGVAR